MKKHLLATASAITLGLAALVSASAPASATNLITNGDFSAGLAGWSEVDSCCYYTDGSGFHEGAVGTNGMLSQTFADTAGAVLTVTFDYSANDGSSYQYVSFDGVTVPGTLVSGPSPYTSYSFTLGIGTGSDTITFNGRNDPSYNTLDNVVVTETPEPASMALVGVGLLGLGLVRRKQG